MYVANATINHIIALEIRANQNFKVVEKLWKNCELTSNTTIN